MNNNQDKNNNYFSMMGLIKKDDIGSFYGEGMWHNFNSLEKVLNIMDKEEMGEEDKHSIPDVYGRAIQCKITFESAKRRSEETGSYFYTREILEWRGIITVIALQNYLNLKLKIDIVTYSDTGKGFDEALKHPPKPEIFPNCSLWESGEFHILALQGDKDVDAIDIALFSQLTVFEAVADLGRKMPKVKNLTWFDYENKKFVNPCFVLTDTEIMIVYFWIEQFEEILRQERADTLLYHLNKYKDELKNELKDELKDKLKDILKDKLDILPYKGKTCFALTEYDGQYENIMNSFGGDHEKINRIMNRTVKRQAQFIEEGGIVKVDYSEMFADQIYYIKKSRSPFLENSFANNYMIKNTGDNVNGRNPWFALIPLGKKVIDPCSRDIVQTLAKNMFMKAIYDADGTLLYIQATLKLSNISKSFIDADKRYYAKNSEELVEETSFPVIALWPSVYMKNCKQYYIYLQGGKNGKIEAVFFDAEKGENTFVKAVQEYPKAISLQRVPRDQKEIYDIGAIIPERDEINTSDNVTVTAVVGIDFGTSGTTVYAKICGENAFPVEIWNDHSKLLTQADEEDQIYLSQYFISSNHSRHSHNKLHSVYRSVSGEPRIKVTPILDGIIYQAGEKEMIEESKLFLPDIKWNDPRNGAYYEAFIEELCAHISTMLMKHNVSVITWRYALPSSLQNWEGYQTIWKTKILNFLNQNFCDVKHNIEQSVYTESEASSLYFQKSYQMKMVNIGKGYIVVDIGGGSTDIAVWQRQGQDTDASLVAQTSIPIAGRKMFTRWISLNIYAIRTYVFNKNAEWEKLQKFKKDTEIVNAILERMIYAESDTILRAYWNDTTWSYVLKMQLEFGMALLFYALGCYVGYLHKKEKLKAYDQGKFSIAVGGNGSKILDWINCGEHYSKLLSIFEKGICSRVCAELFSPRIIKSSNPKEEVARGLLENKTESNSQVTSEMNEAISVEQAVQMNKSFLEAYNSTFEREMTCNVDDICALIERADKQMDILNFFMTELYGKYYCRRMVDKGEDE